jgi:hypothetical protein
VAAVGVPTCWLTLRLAFARTKRAPIIFVKFFDQIDPFKFSDFYQENFSLVEN